MSAGDIRRSNTAMTRCLAGKIMSLLLSANGTGRMRIHLECARYSRDPFAMSGLSVQF